MSALEVLGIHGPVVVISKANACVQVFDHYVTGSGQSLFVIQRLPDRTHCVCSERALELSLGDKVYPAPAMAPPSLSPLQVLDLMKHLVPHVDMPRTDLCPTGILALDVLCPVPRRGSICFLGGGGSGRMTMVEELHLRLAGKDVDLLLVFLIKPTVALLIPEAIREWTNYPPDVSTGIATVWMSCEDADSLVLAESMRGLGTSHWRFSRQLAARGVYPAIDPRCSQSELLRSGLCPPRHLEVVLRIKELIDLVAPLREDPVFNLLVADGRDEEATSRDREICRMLLEGKHREEVLRVLHLERILDQPFFCTERINHRPGTFIAPAESLRLCEEVAWGPVQEVEVG